MGLLKNVRIQLFVGGFWLGSGGSFHQLLLTGAFRKKSKPPTR